MSDGYSIPQDLRRNLIKWVSELSPVVHWSRIATWSTPPWVPNGFLRDWSRKWEDPCRLKWGAVRLSLQEASQACRKRPLEQRLEWQVGWTSYEQVRKRCPDTLLGCVTVFNTSSSLSIYFLVKRKPVSLKNIHFNFSQANTLVSLLALVDSQGQNQHWTAGERDFPNVKKMK